MRLRRFFIVCTLALLSLSAMAQSPEAVLESIRKYPNLGITVGSTYPSVPLTELAATPEGFEPFYFSLVGRHGSRYEQSDSRFRRAATAFNKADSLGILTKEGKALRVELNKIWKAQKGHDGELSELGAKQWHEIGCRAYERFKPVFEGGSIEGKSSTSLRCIFSMAAFNDAIKGCSPTTRVTQQARKSELWIVRPHNDNPAISKEAKRIHKEWDDHGEWNDVRKAWDRSHKAPDFISKVVTDEKRFLKECGAKYSGRIARYAYMTLIFGENFELGNREMLCRLFTPEEIYNFYVYNAARWVNYALGRGNDIVEMKQAHMRTLIEDIINKGNEAIEGKNPHTANVRFTHDSYVGPLLSAMGYEGCVPQWNADIEVAATSYNHGVICPMAANLQIVLYRNNRGKVLVRSLINENDAFLPIKCKTAPFYPWDDFCKFMYENLKRFDKAQERVLKGATK